MRTLLALALLTSGCKCELPLVFSGVVLNLDHDHLEDGTYELELTSDDTTVLCTLEIVDNNADNPDCDDGATLSTVSGGTELQTLRVWRFTPETFDATFLHDGAVVSSEQFTPAYIRDRDRCNPSTTATLDWSL